MVFKSTGSISRFQRKNRFWKIRTESQVITKKLSKIGIPNQTIKIWHIFADISGLGAYFSKPIFALKPWDWAGRFEYHEPYNRDDFFSSLFSLSKGSEKSCFCKLAKGKRSNLKDYFLKSPYFCVLHPLLGIRNINFSFFDFQLTLLCIYTYMIYYNEMTLLSLLDQPHQISTYQTKHD